MNDGARRPDGGATPGEPGEVLERLFRSGRTNALLSWSLVGVIAAVFVESLLDFDLQWMAFVAAAGTIALIPPTAYREWRVMIPWELLALGLMPILVRGLFGGEVGTFAAYLSIASLALIVTVELHMFTSLEVTHWFAVTFVVLTTMASVGAWSIARWYFDRLLGTSYLVDNRALMREFLWVTLAGIVAGVLFDAYFRRRDRLLRRLIGQMIGR